MDSFLLMQICIRLELTAKFKRKSTAHVWHDESTLFSSFPTLIWLFSLLLRGTLSTLLCLIPLTMVYNTVTEEKRLRERALIQLLYWSGLLCPFSAAYPWGFFHLFYGPFFCVSVHQKFYFSLLLKFPVLLHNRMVYS